MQILLISDIHANLVALETVLKHAPPHERVWCLGDVIGYGPHPNECVGKIIALDALCLPGNHDWAVLGKLDVADFVPDAQEAIYWTRRVLKEENRAYLDTLTERVPTQFDRYTLVHASPRQPIWEYVHNKSIARANMDHFDTPVCFVGHTHVPIVYRARERRRATDEALPIGKPFALEPGKMIVNPGSVGQPRDGDPRASYALLDSDANTLTLYRVAYDINATQEAMDAAGLPPRLINRLAFGV